MENTITPSPLLDTLAADLLAALQDAAEQSRAGSFELQRWSFAKRFPDGVALNAVCRTRGAQKHCGIFLLQADDGTWLVGHSPQDGPMQEAAEAALDKALAQIPADKIRSVDSTNFDKAVFAPDQMPVAGYSLSGMLGRPIDVRLSALTQQLYALSIQQLDRDTDAHAIIAVHLAQANLPPHLLAVVHANPGVAGPQMDGPVFSVGAVIEDGKLQIFTPDDMGTSGAARRRQERQFARMDSKANAVKNPTLGSA